MPERRARMLAESTMPGADCQVPIRGHSLSARSNAMPSFASEEREARQTEAAQHIPTATAKSEAVAEVTAHTAEAEVRHDGSLLAGRIWVSPQEMDDATDWDDEAEMEADAGLQFDAETGRTDEIQEIAETDDPGRASEPELVPVAASVFDDDFFRTASGRHRAAAESEITGSASAVADQTASAPASSEQGTRLFAGASSSQAEQSEADELDIPAFLRRSR
jgi:hypothetical protein